MARAKIGSDLYQETVKVLNNVASSKTATDIGISLDDRRSAGAYIYIDCDGDRAETREHLEMLLEKVDGVKCDREYVKSRSTFDLTEITGFGEVLYLVYKATKGGMAETTLNSSITELFPCIAFSEGISTRLDNHQFYEKIVEVNRTKKEQLGAYKNKSAYDAGKGIVDKASISSAFDRKVNGAKGITNWLAEQNKRKTIDKIVWGYRNNTKPTGVNPNHKGDIFIVFTDTTIEGVSIKAGAAGAAEPQFNSYVKPIFTSFGMIPKYNELMKESYDQFYTGIPNIPAYAQYGKQPMTKVVGAFEAKQKKRYEDLYDQQLEWIRQTIVDMMNDHPQKAKNWLLREVAAEQEGVPLVVIKADDNGNVSLIQDEDVIKNCVSVSKKSNGLRAYVSSSSKQNWHIDLTCNAKTTTLNFSIRTNKTGIGHKLGQYINLAVKFNGISKK